MALRINELYLEFDPKIWYQI